MEGELGCFQGNVQTYQNEEPTTMSKSPLKTGEIV